MKEHQIIFSAPMILALLAGTKTQTRRIIRMRDRSLMRDEDLSSDGRTVMDFTKHYPHWQQLHSPFGKPSDHLWVRETCRAEELPDGTNGVRYLADNHFQPIENTAEAGKQWVQLYHYGKRRGATVPPIHAPRWTSRLLLEKTAGRVEQVQDISEADAQAEGVERFVIEECPGEWGLYRNYLYNGSNGATEAKAKTSARESFCSLWATVHSTSGPKSWEANPSVWVEQFKVIRP